MTKDKKLLALKIAGLTLGALNAAVSIATLVYKYKVKHQNSQK